MAIGLITSCDTSTTYNVSYGGSMNPGTIYYLTFTGGTPEGCYTYNGVGSSPTDTVNTISVGYGDCLSCQTSNYNAYYLSGCCNGGTLEILSATELTLNVGHVVYVVWNNNTQGDCFNVVSPQVGYPTYIWDPVNDFYTAPYPDCDTCIVDNEVLCPTPTPTPTLTETPTPTVTETPTQTPTLTQTPTSSEVIVNSPILIQSCDTLIIYDVYYGATLPTIGSVFYMEFTGGTPSGCYTYIALGSSPIDTLTN